MQNTSLKSFLHLHQSIWMRDDDSRHTPHLNFSSQLKKEKQASSSTKFVQENKLLLSKFMDEMKGNQVQVLSFGVS